MQYHFGGSTTTLKQHKGSPSSIEAPPSFSPGTLLVCHWYSPGHWSVGPTDLAWTVEHSCHVGTLSDSAACAWGLETGKRNRIVTGGLHSGNTCVLLYKSIDMYANTHQHHVLSPWRQAIAMCFLYSYIHVYRQRACGRYWLPVNDN